MTADNTLPNTYFLYKGMKGRVEVLSDLLESFEYMKQFLQWNAA